MATYQVSTRSEKSTVCNNEMNVCSVYTVHYTHAVYFHCARYPGRHENFTKTIHVDGYNVSVECILTIRKFRKMFYIAKCLSSDICSGNHLPVLHQRQPGRLY